MQSVAVLLLALFGAIMGQSTTLSPLGGGDVSSTTTAASASECKAAAFCNFDSDCGGEGRCLGAFVGTCNCNACLNFWPCQSDAQCGGLAGACNKASNSCSCSDGLKQAGFPEFFDALRSFCNIKACGAANSTDACFGLPCNSGLCAC